VSELAESELEESEHAKPAEPYAKSAMQTELPAKGSLRDLGTQL
jgi:hypothetical protein